MAQPEQPDSDSPEKSDSADGKKPDGKKPDGKKQPERKSSNLFWYLMIGLVVIAVFVSFTNQEEKGEKLSFGKFQKGLSQSDGKPPRFHKGNVYELTIGPEFITFQDKPKPKSGEDSDSSSEPKRYSISAVGSKELHPILTKELSEKGIDFSFVEPTPKWQLIAQMMFIPLIILVLIIFLIRRMGGAGSAMSFGRSRGKLYAQEDIDITFEDAAGIDEAAEELREIVGFLQHPEKYQALGARIPRGVLLVGPPGTGKTLLAKAVAGEAGVPFFGLSGSDFVEMYVGVGAARVRDMFHQAAQKSPSIIFIDELDALGKTRGSGGPGGHDEREQTLNALLVEMDGFSSEHSVIVMAATNRPETLDPALLRPGRFDRHVLVDRPDVRGREAILKVHAKKIKMDDSVDLHRLARISPGFVGADLANLVNEAALLAVRNNKNRVTMVEFEEGIERVVAGLEKQTRVIHEDERQRIAYHECGHALISSSLPHTDPVHKISIIPRGMGLGYTLHFPEDERQLSTKTELQNRICCLMGGIVAEDIVFEESSTGAQNDLQRATSIARRMVTDFGMSPKLGRVYYSESSRSSYLGFGQSVPVDIVHSEDTIREIDLEVQRIITEASDVVHEILVSRREVLDHMCRDLMESEVMDADHLKRILDQYKTSPQISPGTHALATIQKPKPDTPEGETSPAADSGGGA
ncbi:MAG: ATP-dependent zinc metalloprotease FtsH [Planctomycetes bacterium]|nr:ATP-dependent zinc metalloprotease FtsH [Planctomycetota bacterium]